MNDERMKIMLVEDDKALAGEISSFLRRWGYETIEACQFDKILEEFSQYMPQLVLMDINLPFIGADRSGRYQMCLFFISAAAAMTGIRSWQWLREGMIMWKSPFGWSF